MTPVEIVRNEGNTEVSLSNNKRGYHLVKYRSRFPNFFRAYQGAIFKQNHKGWERTQYDGDHEIMVTCFYNLTRQ